MAGFRYEDTPFAVTSEIAGSHVEAWRLLTRPGTWWTAAQRLAIATRTRERLALRGHPPWLRPEPPGDGSLSPATAAVVDELALEAWTIDRSWADEAIAAMGDGPYVELVAVVATVAMVDVFADAVGVGPEPLPHPETGEPSRIRPDGLGDIGAYVPTLDPFPAANVARALSLVPEANRLFRTVSVPAYSAPGFTDLRWDTPLSRPQVELLASRVAAVNECFY